MKTVIFPVETLQFSHWKFQGPCVVAAHFYRISHSAINPIADLKRVTQIFKKFWCHGTWGVM